MSVKCGRFVCTCASCTPIGASLYASCDGLSCKGRKIANNVPICACSFTSNADPGASAVDSASMQGAGQAPEHLGHGYDRRNRPKG